MLRAVLLLLTLVICVAGSKVSYIYRGTKIMPHLATLYSHGASVIVAISLIAFALAETHNDTPINPRKGLVLPWSRRTTKWCQIDRLRAL